MLGLDDGKRTGGPGIFVQKGIVIGVEDHGKTHKIGEKTYDFAITVQIQVPEKDFADKLLIFGNLSKDKTSWGGAFKIRDFFDRIGNIKERKLNDDYTIPESWIESVIGKQAKFLVYRTTGGFWGRDKNIWNEEITDVAIINSFLNGHKRSGFPSDYSPDAVRVENSIPEAVEVEKEELPF